MSEDNNQVIANLARQKNLSRQDKERLVMLLRERERRRGLVSISSIWATRYNWQKEFCNSTATHMLCMLMCGNRTGKTETSLMLDAAHATGMYPEGYEGHRFTHPPLIWVLGFSGEKIRDLLQTPLFGTLSGGSFEGGLITKDKILDALPMSGTPRCCREVRVKHVSGGVSRVQFWSYSQGQHALMGDNVDWFHIDEEPKDSNIYPQVLTRIASGDKGKGGRGILSFTPENGRTELVISFMDDPAPSKYLKMAGWDDVTHLEPETKEALLDGFPPWQRDMRTKGIPLMGTGLIFDLDITKNIVQPFECPQHFWLINGMDFGWDHPQAHIQLWWDKDEDIYYVAHNWSASKVQPYEAWQHVKGWAESVPTAWPHDGLQTEKGSAKQQKSYYEESGWKMLDVHAQWDDGSNGVEAGLMEIYNLLKLNKLRIFSTCTQLLDEMRQYHRDEKGKIVKVRDDNIDCMRYAYMMKRYAVRKYDIINQYEYDDYDDEPLVDW